MSSETRGRSSGFQFHLVEVVEDEVPDVGREGTIFEGGRPPQGFEAGLSPAGEEVILIGGTVFDLGVDLELGFIYEEVSVLEHGVLLHSRFSVPA